jgi:hypothetical protein
LADPEKFTLPTPPNSLDFPLAFCPALNPRTRELAACRRWSIPENATSQTNLGLTHWSLACCSPSIPSLTDRFGRRADQRVKRTIFLYLIVQPEEHHPGPLNDLNANDTYNQNASAGGPDKPRFNAPWRLNSDRVSPTTVTSICLIPDKPRFSRYSTPPKA